MRKLSVILTGILLLTAAGLQAQENWDMYMASYEKGVGSEAWIRVDYRSDF